MHYRLPSPIDFDKVKDEPFSGGGGDGNGGNKKVIAGIKLK